MVEALCIDITSGACANTTALAFAYHVGREEIAPPPLTTSSSLLGVP